MLKVSHLKKSFAHLDVLKDISFEIHEGEVLALIGPSGSGKSTLLRTLNFLEKPDDGIIQFKDRNIEAKKATKEDIMYIRKHSAMVFQQFNLFKYKTALENVTEGLIQVQKMKKADAIALAREELGKVGLQDRENYYPRQLSGGQKQRVGIARALALHPDIILLDEPTSALDPEMIGEVLDVIRQAKADGHTMMIVSHEMNFVYEIADHILFMEGGYIVEEGSPDDIFLHPKKPRTQQFLSRVRTQKELT